MKLIKPDFEIIDIKPRAIAIPDDMEIGPQMVKDELLDTAYRQIELAGRTCYKSEAKITDTSAKDFVDRMIASGHNAMLEFGTIYLKIDFTTSTMANITRETHYSSNQYSVEKRILDENSLCPIYYITTNLRVLVENNWLEDLQYICEPTEYHERRVHVKFITDRGISHELVRHKQFCAA